MQGVHDARNARKWLEGQIVSYLYGGTDEHTLGRSVLRVSSSYKVSQQEIRSLFQSVEKNLVVYYGGRYRLAYGAMGRRFGGANFLESQQKSVIMRSLSNLSRSLPESR